MTRLWLAALVALGLAAAAVATAEIDTDARALVGDDGSIVSALDTADGRSALLAVVDADRERRNAIARAIVEDLADEPMVARASAGVMTPPPGLADWLWRERFTLSPPPPPAFASEAMTMELMSARAALTSVGGGGLAHYYLLDPTGSFRRLIEALALAAGGGLPVADGVVQSLDDRAALVTIELAARPFDVDAQRALDRSIIEHVEHAGAEAIMVGPRPIAARVSAGLERSSKIVAGIGGGLLLLWLVAVLRSALSLARVCLPLAIGLAGAVLAVQTVFGSVHVVALGFGGALTGLALDYPLHLLSHARTGGDMARTRRLILLGASTTGVAFLSLLGAGIPAIGQVGLFVAAGLSAAAVAAIAIGVEGESRHAWQSPRRTPPPAIRWKLPALAILGLVAGAVVSVSSGPGTRGLFELPSAVTESIAALDRMIGLPSGRYRIEVEASTLGSLLAQQRRLEKVLAEARAAGAIGRSSMLADKLPGGDDPSLPDVEAFAAALSGVLRKAGMREGFGAEIIDAYRKALQGPPLGSGEVAPMAGPLASARLVRVEGDRLVATVSLWDVADPARIEDAVRGLSGVRFIDEQTALSERLDQLIARIGVCFLIGIAGCATILALALRSVRPVVEILASCLAAAALAAASLAIVGDGISVFTLIALALVVGIGIDYGIFLTSSEDPEASAVALSSVGLCASTTLIAFLVMAFFGTGLLRDIGMTVSIGVAATAVASSLRQKWSVGRG